MTQLFLFPDSESKISAYEKGLSDIPALVSFRELVPEITDTGYLTHSIYYYPAKFIPHVVRFCINEYTSENNWVADPFAGSGTVGLEAFICQRNALLLDLNPMLNCIIPLKIYQGDKKFDIKGLYAALYETEKSQNIFQPDWSNITYWYPKEIYDLLCQYWGGYNQLEKNIYALIIQSALIKVSRHFSYAEHKIPKLFKSKTKVQYIEKILKNNWKESLKKMIYDISSSNYRCVCQFLHKTEHIKNKVLFFGGVDSTQFDLSSENIEIDCLISSPPYLQAQEYIRTAKLDLYWLGYSEEYIKKISRLEIPYRKPVKIIETETLNHLKSKLTRPDLLKIIDSYFCHTIQVFENVMKYMKKNGKVCIFTGNPRIDGIEVETWKILTEYFIERGFNFDRVFEDKIKTRQLFGFRKNKNPDGMRSEYLLLLSKK